MTWEYLVENLQGSNEKQTARLNALGEAGWELVHLSVNNKVGYFKRPQRAGGYIRG